MHWLLEVFSATKHDLMMRVVFWIDHVAQRQNCAEHQYNMRFECESSLAVSTCMRFARRGAATYIPRQRADACTPDMVGVEEIQLQRHDKVDSSPRRRGAGLASE